MNDTKNTTKVADKGSKDSDTTLGQLLKEIKGINKEIDTTNDEANAKMSEIEAKVDSAIKDIDHSASLLDKAEKDAENGLDSIILEQADDMDKEEAGQKEE